MVLARALDTRHCVILSFFLGLPVGAAARESKEIYYGRSPSVRIKEDRRRIKK